MRARKRWIVVATSTRARVVRCATGRDEPAPPELVLRAESRRLRDNLADRPGRSFSSGSEGRRSAMEPRSDPLREDTRDFVRQIATLLETHRLAQDYEELVIVATPRMLGALREGLPASLRSVTRAEIARDFGTAAAADLPDLVTRALAERRP